MESESVHCCITSPPYWGLRAYGGQEGMIGLEPTLAEHIDRLVEVFREVRRVLRSDGTVWLNYGDSYAGSWGNYGPTGKGGQRAKHTERYTRPAYVEDQDRLPPQAQARKSGFKPKDRMMIGHRLAIALQDDGWWVRDVGVWHKTNPTPESVKDRPANCYEHVFFLTKARYYFYDHFAVRVPAKADSMARLRRAYRGYTPDGQDEHKGIMGPRERRPSNWADSDFYHDQDPRYPVRPRGHERPQTGLDQATRDEQMAGGANFRNVWSVATVGFPGSHYATFPPKLIEPFVKASTSEQGVCPECGEPWERLLEVEGRREGGYHDHSDDLGAGQSQAKSAPFIRRKTVGWSLACACAGAEAVAKPTHGVPATLLDPFAGVCTVGLVAARLGRSAELIEINPEYVDLGSKRIFDDNPLFADLEVIRLDEAERLLP